MYHKATSCDLGSGDTIQSTRQSFPLKRSVVVVVVCGCMCMYLCVSREVLRREGCVAVYVWACEYLCFKRSP